MPPVQTPYQGARRSGGSGDLRHGNLTQILRYVRDHGASSRHDIARGCGLGISTMTDLIGELRSRRLVRELDPVRRPGAGRPTRPIDFDGEPWAVLGVHVDLDQVSFAASTLGGRELMRERVPADLRNAGADVYPQLAALLTAQLDKIPAGPQLVALEVGVGGAISADRATVVLAERFGWHDFDLGAALSDTLQKHGLGSVAVSVSNECQLSGLYAARVELALPTETIAVYLGGTRTIGTALIARGEIFRGAGGRAGSFAHLNIDPAGPKCWCGRSGCLESLAGPVALLTATGLLPHEEARELVDRDPEAASRMVVEAAARGEAAVLEAIGRVGDPLGRAIDDIVGATNPHAVILGGYLGVLGEHLLPRLHEQLRRRVAGPAYAGTETVAVPGLGPRSVHGAVLAARDACYYDPLTLTHPVA